MCPSSAPLFLVLCLCGGSVNVALCDFGPMHMDLVSLAYVALFGVTLVPPAIGVVIPFPVNVMLTSFLIVYIGSHLSLEANEENGETMTMKDAAWFPIVGSAALLSLFVAIKYLGPYYVNLLLSAYFFVLGVIAVGASLSPFFARLVDGVKAYKFNLPFVGEFELTAADIVGGVFGVAFASYYVATKHFLANNLLGIAFCLQGVERTSLGGYGVGALLLVGLFFYDIYWVFFTPVMVGVAKNIDGPIKLLFPRALATADSDAVFSMLGLGDIVLPGIFIALLLRYDAHRSGIDTTVSRSTRKDFPKTMFNTNLFAYTVGLLVTLVVMLKFQHAQPALLYLVPACVGCSLLVAPFAGGYGSLFAYKEGKEEPTTADATGEGEGGDADDEEEEQEEEDAPEEEAQAEAAPAEESAADAPLPPSPPAAAAPSPPVSSGMRRRRRREM